MRVLVAGVGNIFKADDAFGCEVAQRFLRERKPTGSNDAISVIDFGIRSFDLAYELLDGGYDFVVLVDAIQRGGAPGTLYVIEPDLKALEELESHQAAVDSHGMHPSKVLAKVLAWAKALGRELPVIRLVGCEPEDIVPEDEDVRVGLTSSVANAIDEAVQMVQRLIAESMQEREACMR